VQNAGSHLLVGLKIVPDNVPFVPLFKQTVIKFKPQGGACQHVKET
jgi:hypothetical protein